MAKTTSKTEEKAKSKEKTAAVSKVKQPEAEVWARELEEAIQRTDKGYLDQARLLHQGYTSTYASDLGYDKGGFEELLEKRFGMKYTKAMYFVRMQAKILELEIKPQALEALPWSKLREIIPVMDAANQKEWLDKAKKLNQEDLHKQVMKSKKHDDDAPVITTMKFKFPSDTIGFVEDALSLGRQMLLDEDGEQKVGDAEVLAHICGEWLEYKGGVPEKIKLEDMAAWAKRAWGEHIDILEQTDEAEAEDLSELDEGEETEESEEETEESEEFEDEEPEEVEGEEESDESGLEELDEHLPHNLAAYQHGRKTRLPGNYVHGRRKL